MSEEDERRHLIDEFGEQAVDRIEDFARRTARATTSTPAGLREDVLALALMNTMPDVLDWEEAVAAEYARLAASKGADR